MENNDVINLDCYKLSCELRGHSLDVRALAEGRDFIISGSRDKTTKIWKKEHEQFTDAITLLNHSNFVSSVLYLKEEGWICTGSNDSTICVYNEISPVPFTILKGHQDTVCALSNCSIPKSLISGSWDKTAKIWTINELGQFTFTELKGHEAAVWAVTCLKNGKYATGGADKIIILWNTKGEKIHTIQGHKDCVRGLVGLEDDTLLSCSNDATICLWSSTGECLREFYGHANFIYTISMNTSFGSDKFISGSEDSTIRMWSLKSGAIEGSIALPAESVWSVLWLENDDIATATSDGVVRIFTKDPNRFASDDILKSFQLAVYTREMETNKELGGIKRTDLPGPESLLQPGNEGQTKLVRHPDGKVTCYEWSNNKWNTIGEVLGAGENKTASTKSIFEGKEYDYVFSVDISDSEPPIKLPYNKGEDPWLSAQKFIHRHNLPQAYLDQVANFILTNSDSSTTEKHKGFEDPFTGGSRYIPGATSEHFNSVGNTDPFTGGSSYTTVSNQKPEVKFTRNGNEVLTDPNKPFPLKMYLTFDNYDSSKILDKLREFNSKFENDMRVSEDILNAIIKLAEQDAEVDTLSVEALQHLMIWPKEIIFPVIDIARLAVRNEKICNMLANDEFLTTIIKILTTSPANQLMCIRFFANMMQHSIGRKLIIRKLNDIMLNISKINQGSANLQIAIATFLTNITISQLESTDTEICRLIAEEIINFFKWATDSEAFYRALLAIGNLTCTQYGPLITAQIVSVDYVITKIQDMAKNQYPKEFEKISICATVLLANLK